MAQVVLEPLHRFHPYCARFPSEVVEAAIAQYSQLGESIFDPFCGSGTTLVTGLAHGRKVVGADIDILAGMLSEVKCHPFAPQRYTTWRKRFYPRPRTSAAGGFRSYQSCGSIEARLKRSGHSGVPSFPQLPKLRLLS